MKQIHILHLIPKLLSLYGEYGNVAVLKKLLTDNGCAVSVDLWENGPLDLQKYDFIYMGSGTEENLSVAVQRLTAHTDGIRASIESGVHWLVTGNAMSVFGHSGLNVLPFDTQTDPDKRFMGDVMTDAVCGGPLVGYINTSCTYSGVESPFAQLWFGKHLGNDKSGSPGEGIAVHHFIGTQLIGPVLVKNPHLLCQLATEITGEQIQIDPESYLQKAYETTLREMQKRAEN